MICKAPAARGQGRRGLALAACLLAIGCTATLGSPEESNEASTRAFSLSAGLRRLTQAEYIRTLESLLGVKVDSKLVPRELLVRGHSQIGPVQRTGYGDIEAYYGLALSAAEQAVPRLLAETNCSEAECVEKWLAGFLPRALRVPVTSDVLADYASLLDAPDAGSGLQERLVTLLAAVFTSPTFLYKQEIGEVPSAEGGVLLAPHELATRLSYLVWQSEPDAELLALGEQLRDPEVRLDQLQRMLADPKARPGLRHFVQDWMGAFENKIPSKDVGVLSGLSSTVAASAERSFELFVDAELFGTSSGRFAQLLTSDRLFVDAALAPIYDLENIGAEFQEVTVQAPERRGMLAHPFIISAHSKESGASPFPIGKFLYENLLCETIPPPPAGIPAVPEDAESEMTLRQRLEDATKGEPCHSCHERIGPPGFAFLQFDPVGRFNALDGLGRPYDTAGLLVLPDRAEPVPFNGVSELSKVLSEDPVVADCLARRMFRWAYGRFEGHADKATLKELTEVSVDTATSVEGLLRAVVASPSFAQVELER